MVAWQHGHYARVVTELLGCQVLVARAQDSPLCYLAALGARLCRISTGLQPFTLALH
jgi:hypothetical protein